jgi:molybdopterin converting factor subunit 1
LRLQVLLFASYADAFGAPEVAIELPVGATVRELLSAVRALAPTAALPTHPLVAVNQAYASAGHVVRPGDEVALIPPVAGG